MTDEEYLKYLTEWLNGDLWHEVHELLQQTHVFRSWNEILGMACEESRRPGVFHRWVVHNYLDSIASAVRRLSDRDERTTSLTRFLDEVASGAHRLTHDWWMSGARSWEREQREERFAELGRGNDHVDPGLALEDKERVEQASAKVKAYVDTYVAHLDADRAERVVIPTFGDAHSAVQVIYQVYHQWFQNITRQALVPVRPPRWEHVLTVPWITPDQATEIAENQQQAWKQDMIDLGIAKE